MVTFLAVNFTFNILYVTGRYTDAIPNMFYYLFSITIGISFVLFLYLILHEFIELFHKSLKNVDQSKRNFIKKSGDGMLLALSSGYVGAAVYEGSKEPVINVVNAKLFDFSIVQISDLHIGGLIDRAFVKRAVEQINSLNADIVVITGDLIDSKIDKVKESVLELTKIKAKHGIYYVLGNHEYFHQPSEIIEFMKNTSIKLLLNESVTVEALKVNIVGVTDLFGYRAKQLEPNITKAYATTNKAYPSIFLVHQPKFINELRGHTPKLVLSGHTHGGQIWPFNHLVTLQQPYVKGLHEYTKDSFIYVNSGIGFWGPPMRLNSQAEIAYIV